MDPELPAESPHIPLDVVDRVFSGEGTPEEVVSVHTRLSKYPTLTGYFDDLRTYLGASPHTEDGQSSLSWEAMSARLAQHEQSIRAAGRKIAPPKSGSRHWWTSRAVFASLVISAISAVTFGVLHTRVSNQPSVATHVTHAAQYAVVPLSNGVEAILGPMTRIEAATTSNALNVTVLGQAHFRVRQHASTPVVVRTRNAIVSVLGTAFSVRQYANESRSQVLVEDGRVSVMRGRATRRVAERAVLAAGMSAQVADSGIRVMSDGKAAVSTNWTNGKLVFDGAALRDIVDELATVYGTDIKVTDSVLAHQSMLIEVTVKEQPLSRVLDFICLAVDAHYKRIGDGYILVPGRVSRRESPRRMFPEPQKEKQYGL